MDDIAGIKQTVIDRKGESNLTKEQIINSLADAMLNWRDSRDALVALLDSIYDCAFLDGQRITQFETIDWMYNRMMNNRAQIQRRFDPSDMKYGVKK